MSLFDLLQHSRPGSVKCWLRGPNKLLICGRAVFSLTEYFLILERNLVFAWHTEVVRPPEPCKREVSGLVKTSKKTILKAPSPTAPSAKVSHCQVAPHVLRRVHRVPSTRRCTRRGVRGGVHQPRSVNSQLFSTFKKKAPLGAVS